MASMSPFIPAPRTPLAECEPGDVDLAINAIAIIRLLKPEISIPSVSALEKLRKGGQILGLLAGANVLTVNFTQEAYRSRYEIYGSGRFVVTTDHVRRVAEAAKMPVTL